MKESTNTHSVRASSSSKEPGSGCATTPLKRYKVTIAGESYFLVSDEPEERIKEVAHLVDTKIQALTRLSQNDDSKRVATLVALQCASTLIAYEERAEKLIDHLTKELSHLSL